MQPADNPWRTVAWQLIVGCVLVCACITVVYRWYWPVTYQLTYNETDNAYYRHVYAAETNAAGEIYHWTASEAQLIVPRSTWAALTVVDMTVLNSARPVVLNINTLAVPIDTATRRVSVLVAQPTWLHTTIDLRTPALRLTNDDRLLGVRLADVRIHGVASRWPSPLWLLLGCWLIGCVVVLCHVSGVPVPYTWIGVVLVPVMCVWVIRLDASYATAWLYAWSVTWLVVALGMVCIRCVLPQLPLSVRIAVVVWLTIRVLGITYPGFDGHDYVIHAKRLLTMSEQHRITVLDYPYEFNRRPALIVPLFYGVAYLLQPLFGTDLAMHLIAISAETGTALLLWAWLTRAGVTPRIATITTILVLAMPLSSVVLWWAFFPQILAHTFLFALMLATSRQDMRGAWWAGVLCAAIAWTHIGEILIAAVWYVSVRMFEPDRGMRDWWWRWVPVVTIPLSALLVYVPYLQLLLNNPPAREMMPLARTWISVLSEIKEAFAVGLAPIPWWVLPVLAGVAWWQSPRVARPWLVATIWWLVVEVISTYNVRSIYAAMPVFVLGLAFPLTRIAQRRSAGRMFVVVIIAFVAWVSAVHWHDATLWQYRLRIDGLTH